MGNRIRCFLVEETGQVQIALRRYTSLQSDRRDCSASGLGYHNAEAAIDVQPAQYTVDGYLEALKRFPIDDPRWPKECACGYKFLASDEWQTSQHQLYVPAKNSIELAPAAGPWTFRKLPPGAMLYPSWLQPREGIDSPRFHLHPGPDGKILMVITPAGEWIIDSESSNGTKGQRGWQRSGEPPNVTASPSIGIGEPFRYHGWLRDGFLEEC